RPAGPPRPGRTGRGDRAGRRRESPGEEGTSRRRRQLPVRRRRVARQRRQREPLRQRSPLADGLGEADRDRSEDARAGFALAHAVPGAPHRPLLDRRSAGARGHARRVGLVPPARLMSSRRLLVLPGAGVALFAFIFLFERTAPTTGERQQKGELYWDLPEDQVESIRLERGNETVELAKQGDTWRLVRPEAYPADGFAVSDLSSQLADLKKPEGESSAGGKPEHYGLSKPSAKATFVWKDPKTPARKESRTLEFGLDIPGMDLTAARVAGTSRILFVPASVAAAVRKPTAEFKRKAGFG